MSPTSWSHSSCPHVAESKIITWTFVMLVLALCTNCLLICLRTRALRVEEWRREEFRLHWEKRVKQGTSLSYFTTSVTQPGRFSKHSVGVWDERNRKGKPARWLRVGSGMRRWYHHCKHGVLTWTLFKLPEVTADYGSVEWTVHRLRKLRLGHRPTGILSWGFIKLQLDTFKTPRYLKHSTECVYIPA